MSQHSPKFRIKSSVRKAQSGQGLVEYALLLGLLALAVVGVVAMTGDGVKGATIDTKNHVGGEGSNFTPGVAPTLGNSTYAVATGAPTYTPVPPTPTFTAVPPTNTPTPTKTPTPTNTPTNTPTPLPSTTPNATQTAQAASLTATANTATSGAALRYIVDPNGWNKNADGYCGGGVVGQSGNNGLTTVTLMGMPGDYVCFRIDTYVANNTNPAAKARIVAQDQGPVQVTANLGFVLSLNKTYTNATNTVDVVYNLTNTVPIYARAKIPSDVCNQNKGKVNIGAISQGTDSGIGMADAVVITFGCSNPPTPTPKVTNTPAPTATPLITATPTPLPTVDSGS
jgi:Flp pilus assembly pilin Flp